MKRQNVHFLWHDPLVTRKFSSAISLHSHTDRSREGFGGIEQYSEDSALIGFAVSRISSHYRKLIGADLNFEKAYFAPPLAPVEAYRLEASQIDAMGMNPMVSITDHDSIEAPAHLQTMFEPNMIP